MKKIVALLLAAIMILSAAACTSGEPKTSDSETTTTVSETTTTAATESETTAVGESEKTDAEESATEGASEEVTEGENGQSSGVWNLDGTMFPLDEKVKFTILTSGYRYATLSDISKCQDWIDLCEACNIEVEFVYLGEYDAPESGTNLQMRLMSGDYGDAIISVYLDNMTKADINEMVAADMLVNLDQYMNDPAVMPNFYNTVIKPGKTYLLKGMKSDDNQIYAFYGIGESAAYTANEGLMQVNTEWLQKWQEARNVDHTPETIDEFEDMLLFFHDSDLNGNGETDEIPYFIAQATYNGTSSLEASMGMYGIGIKDSAADMDIMIDDDGNCYYVYTTDEYKAGLEKFASWYKEGLIYEEIFTANAETIASVVADASQNLGVINCCYDIEGFEAILPPTVEGYTAKYHTHPAVRSGISSQPFGVITDKCEHPEVLAAFFDLMYQYDNYLTWRYGSKIWEDGEITFDADGKYVFNVPSEPDKSEDPSTMAIYNFIWGIEDGTLENFAKVDIESVLGDRACVKGYLMYEEKGLWNKTENLWPRCSIVAESADDYSFMYTDVSSVVAEYRAKFITGQLDVEGSWDEFQEKIKALGVEEMRDIIQASYDAYLAN